MVPPPCPRLIFPPFYRPQDYKELPERQALANAAETLRAKYMNPRSSTSLNVFLAEGCVEEVMRILLSVLLFYSIENSLLLPFL